MRAKSRKLSIEHLDCRVLLAADVATLPDVASVDDHGRDEIQVCFDHEAQQILHGQFEDAAESDVWPDQISLPTGFEPEGIELGRGHEFFAGAFSFSSFLGPRAGQNHPTSLYAGAIYKGDLQTGQGAILVQPTGRPIAGLSYDVRTDNIYAAVGDSSVIGAPRSNVGVVVYNGTTGAKVAEIIFGDGVGLNDILVTKSAVFGTDSTRPVIYKIPLNGGGRLPSEPTFEEIELTGPQVGARNNGLVGSFDGNDLVVINDGSGLLHRIDTRTGAATIISVDGEQTTFATGDGLYLSGRTLYIMQNQVTTPGARGKIAVVQLSGDLSQGTFVKDIKNDDLFRRPTTIIGFGDSIYAINSNVLFDGSSEDVIFNPGEVTNNIVKVPK